MGSRYYDPVIGRFISADEVNILSINQGNLLQYNLYSYCLNNPINHIDELGTFAVVAFLGAAAAGAVNAIPYVGPLINGLISGGYASYKSYVTGGSNTDIFISGVTSAFASVASLSNVARAGKISLSILEASVLYR